MSTQTLAIKYFPATQCGRCNFHEGKEEYVASRKSQPTLKAIHVIFLHLMPSWICNAWESKSAEWFMTGMTAHIYHTVERSSHSFISHFSPHERRQVPWLFTTV